MIIYHIHHHSDTVLMKGADHFFALPKLLYGEPWGADYSPMECGLKAALKENTCYLDEGIGIFCDDTRDLIKGHVFYEEEPGIVNGGSTESAIKLSTIARPAAMSSAWNI